jgi:hypothetical protein
MHGTETGLSEVEASGVVGYQPETPFVVDGVAKAGAPATAASVPRPEASYQRETPFVAEYALDPGAPSPEAELYAEVLSELEDQAFEEAVTDLVHEASALAEERFSYEAGSPAEQRLEAERGLRDYFEPLAQECEALVDRVAQGVGTTDFSTMSESEVEAFLDRFAPAETTLPPTHDRFLHEFFLGKIKTLVKKGMKLATKLSPVHLVLGKLKQLVRPLLTRVLRFAIDKLPVAVRPIARQLASRFLGVKVAAAPKKTAAAPTATLDAGDAATGDAVTRDATAEPAAGEPAPEPAAADPGEIAQELDARIAGYMVEGEDFERHATVEEFAAEQSAATADTLGELEQRRAEFARDVTGLSEGESAAPVVERFVPAILAALRLGIKVVGRPRVVNFLAGLLAKFIGKYVGNAQSVQLSRSLVDTGLRLVSLETAADESLEAGYALASTLEDTVARVTQEAPSVAWESEEVLEGYVREAFAKAASAHFPDSMIRPELHEAAQTSGAWVALPGGTRRKHYKKYTQVLDVTITPPMAAAAKSFGGTPLHTVLRDQAGMPLGRPVAARVHLYEALPGSTLADIAMHEKTVRGLGSSRREAWSQIHPLTPEAAAALLKEPGLGRQVDARFLADPGSITVGQRFYYLELRNATPRTVPGPRRMRRPPRVAQTRIVFDFPKGELRARLFYSETEAQALATHLRARAPAAVVLSSLKAGLEARIAAMVSGAPTRALRVVHEAVPIEQFQSPVIGGALRVFGRPLGSLLVKWLLEALRREVEQRYDRMATEFTRAAVSEADGVTIVITFQRPSFFAQLRRFFSGAAGQNANTLIALFQRQAFSEFTLAIRAGYALS